MPGNSPYDVVRHHGLYGGYVFARVCDEQRLDLVEITHFNVLTDGVLSDCTASRVNRGITNDVSFSDIISESE
jgi:hypothetical protein